MGELHDYFSVCFNSMKLRYAEFDQMIESLSYLYPTDKINVFINLESIIKNLSMIKDFEAKVLMDPNFSTIMISNMLNVCAHYKKFFVGNRLHTRVFLYMTEFDSEDYAENELDDDYRSFYHVKYCCNPKYATFYELWKSEIYKQAKTIFDFIPDVYFITTKNIDGSVIPMVISEMDKSYKNFIMTSDLMETQYNLMDNFSVFQIKRGSLNSSVSYRLKDYLANGFKIKITMENESNYLNLYRHRAFYLSLLTSVGCTMRCIEKIFNLTPLRNTKYLVDGLADGKIQADTESPELLQYVYPNEMRNDFSKNLKLFDITTKYRKLTKEDIYQITSQLVDRFDNNSLLQLNNTKFVNHQLMLEELTCQF